jgi:carboxypeptidase Taq
LPKLKQETGNTLAHVSLDDFVFAINEVTPSKIRVEADEVTYGLHIIIRFNLERDLFAEKIDVDELPQIWNESYKQYLGLNIENDSEGVMQDTHWASGLYGYFPSYALGNIYSGQMLECMEKTVTDWRTQVANGNFQQVKSWLNKNVHVHGDLYTPAELIQVITKKPFTVQPFLSYLQKKYSGLYGF